MLNFISALSFNAYIYLLFESLLCHAIAPEIVFLNKSNLWCQNNAWMRENKLLNFLKSSSTA